MLEKELKALKKTRKTCQNALKRLQNIEQSIKNDPVSRSLSFWKSAPKVGFFLQAKIDKCFWKISRSLARLKSLQEREEMARKYLLSRVFIDAGLSEEWTSALQQLILNGQKEISDKYKGIKQPQINQALKFIHRAIPLFEEALEFIAYKERILLFAENARKERRAATMRAKIEENRAFIKEYKQTPCVDCGQLKEDMTFDHVVGTKEFNVWAGLTESDLGLIKEEIAKCQVVCRPCHDIREYERGRMFQKQTPDWITEELEKRAEEAAKQKLSERKIETPIDNPRVNLGKARKADLRKISRMLKKKNVDISLINDILARGRKLT